MKRTRLILCSIVILLTTVLYAQKPGIKFTEQSYDFGTVREEDGRVSHIFEFINTGTSDLVLTNVQASCGCTTPQWSRQPIAPKQKGSITVTYSAAGRPGPFTKTITVTSNADRQMLTIRGTVTPRGQKVENVYPVLFNDIRLKSKTITFGDLANTESRKEQFPVANISSKDVTVSFKGLPKYVTAETKTLKAGEKGNITFTINGAKAKGYGSQESKFSLSTKGGDEKTKKEKKLELTSKVNILEKFTDDQFKNPPVAKFDKIINLGKITAGSKTSANLVITNTGKNPLIIRSISNDNPELKISDSKDNIAVGKSANIKIKLDASKVAAGTFSKTIQLRFNEPNKDAQTVNVIYVVEPKTVAATKK